MVVHVQLQLMETECSQESNEGGIRGKTPYVLERFDLEYIQTV